MPNGYIATWFHIGLKFQVILCFGPPAGFIRLKLANGIGLKVTSNYNNVVDHAKLKSQMVILIPLWLGLTACSGQVAI